MKGYKINRDRVRNDLDAILSGHMPVHRNNPKDGQTEYYYMMPQSDDEFTDYDIIDVPTKDTPNPRIQSPQINYNQRLNSNVPDNQNILKNYYKNQKIANEILPTVVDMGQEYFNMKNHDFKYLDDYHHCKANFNVAQENEARAAAARFAGDAKELFDYYANTLYKGLSPEEAHQDAVHDMAINRFGLQRGLSGNWSSAEEACAHLKGAATVNQ